MLPLPAWPLLESGTSSGSSPSGSAILMESSGYILTETGSHILIE